MRASRIVETGLWLVAAACAFWSTLWVLGPNGFGRLRYDDVPRWLDPLSLFGANGQSLALPSVPVRVDGPGQHVFDAVVPHYAVILSSDIAVIEEPTNLQQLCYAGLHLITYAAVAYIAISLARMVASSRIGSPFTESNAARLRLIGLVLLIGAPMASLASWFCRLWMVEGSSVGGKVHVYDYRFSSFPLWTMLVGAAVLVLADVWKRGVVMAEDVRGLV